MIVIYCDDSVATVMIAIRSTVANVNNVGMVTALSYQRVGRLSM